MSDAYDFWAERLSTEEQAAIGQFWEKFSAIADGLDRAFTGEESDVDPTEATIDAIGPLSDMGIFWEYGPGERGHHLALSPELNHSARPLARALVRQAPELDRWTFSDARPANTLDENTVSLVSGRANMAFPLTGAQSEAATHNRIDIVGEGNAVEDTLGGIAGLTFSVLFGEEIERDWLGTVHGNKVGMLSSMFRRAPEPVSWLPAFVDSTQDLLDQLLAARSDLPRGLVHGDDPDFTLYSLDPSGDEIGLDLVTYNTAHPDIAETMLSGARVSANRFTRFAESFCGVAIARTEAHSFNEVDDRSALADALHTALSEQQIGGLIGEAHGKNHIYIDFATSDIPLAIVTLETIIGRAGIAGPAVFRFHEAGLEELTLRLTAATLQH